MAILFCCTATYSYVYYYREQPFRHRNISFSPFSIFTVIKDNLYMCVLAIYRPLKLELLNLALKYFGYWRYAPRSHFSVLNFNSLRIKPNYGFFLNFHQCLLKDLSHEKFLYYFKEWKMIFLMIQFYLLFFYRRREVSRCENRFAEDRKSCFLCVIKTSKAKLGQFWPRFHR